MEDAVPSIYKPAEFRERPLKFTVSHHANEIEELKKVIEEKTTEILCLQQENEKLRTLLTATAAETESLKKYKIAIQTVFNSDQVQNLTNVYNNKWTVETIETALKIKFACGSGYDTLLKLNYPLPSLRTLSRKVEHITFSPGILHEIFNFLAIKVQNFEECEKDCCIYIDEMAITPGKQYYVATSLYLDFRL